MKTGLDMLAELHGSTAEEIKILLLAEGHNPESYLGDSVTTDVIVPPGRDAALVQQLRRGRAGEISVSRDVIKAVSGKDIEQNSVRSDQLPDILGIKNMTDDSSESVSEDEETAADETSADVKTSEEKDTEYVDTEKKNEPVRKKTKYSMNKATANEIFKPDESTPSIKAIRMLFLSLPRYKAQDIAVMSDEDIQAEFSKNYVCVAAQTGTLILPKYNCAKIKEILSGNDNYFIPTA